MSALTAEDLTRTRTTSSRLELRKSMARQHVHHLVMRWIGEIARLETDAQVDAFLEKLGRAE